MFIGCKREEEDPKNDPNTLTLLMPYNKMTPLLDAMKAEFPEINFEIEVYVGDNSSYYLSERISHGDAGDLIYYTVFTSLEEHINQFYDLSDTTIPSVLKSDILSLLDTNGSIYQIPGPLETRCIAYNKTLFNEYGWKTPNNFDELIELVKQIRKDAPEITPIASAGQDAYYFSIPAAIAQAGFLSTSDGYEWEQKFFKGQTSMEQGFKDGLIGTQRLIEAGAFDGEKYSGIWNCDSFMANREAAMNIQWGGINTLYLATGSSTTTDEFGFIPFFGLNENDKVIIFNSSGNWSVNRKLQEDGNEQKLENALKVMRWLTTREAQELMRTNNSQLSVTKDDFAIDEGLFELLELSQNGFKDPMMYTGYEHLIVETGTIVREAVLSGNTDNMINEFNKVGDELNNQYVENKDSSKFGSYLKDDLDRNQTTQLIANIIQDRGLGDFTLITQTGVKNGISNELGTAGNLYAGGITMQDVLLINADRAMHVATVELTGAEVKKLIEEGKGVVEGETHYLVGEGPEIENPETLPHEYFEYFWSGIDVNMKNGKVTSIKYKGEELSDTQTYKVVFSENDYHRTYLDKAIVYDLLIQDILHQYFMKTPEVYAPEVSRK